MSKTARRTRTRFACSACDVTCEHVAGLLSIVLEQKMDLGLAAPPPDVTHAADEAKLVATAIEERAARAKKERMKILSSNPKAPWTDYEVRSSISGKTYRVALRSEVPGESYCSCPDFKTNTLGTCKHIMKVLDKARSFPAAVRNKPYARRRVTVHLRYHDRDGVALAVALPHRLSEDARAIVEPLTKAKAPIDVHDLVQRLRRLDAGGHAFFVTPDAEELIQRRLLAER